MPTKIILRDLYFDTLDESSHPNIDLHHVDEITNDYVASFDQSAGSGVPLTSVKTVEMRNKLRAFIDAEILPELTTQLGVPVTRIAVAEE